MEIETKGIHQVFPLTCVKGLNGSQFNGKERPREATGWTATDEEDHSCDEHQETIRREEALARGEVHSESNGMQMVKC